MITERSIQSYLEMRRHDLSKGKRVLYDGFVFWLDIHTQVIYAAKDHYMDWFTENLRIMSFPTEFSIQHGHVTISYSDLPF